MGYLPQVHCFCETGFSPASPQHPVVLMHHWGFSQFFSVLSLTISAPEFWKRLWPGQLKCGKEDSEFLACVAAVFLGPATVVYSLTHFFLKKHQNIISVYSCNNRCSRFCNFTEIYKRNKSLAGSLQTLKEKCMSLQLKGLETVSFVGSTKFCSFAKKTPMPPTRLVILGFSNPGCLVQRKGAFIVPSCCQGTTFFLRLQYFACGQMFLS